MKTGKTTLIAEAIGNALAHLLSAFQRATASVWSDGLPAQDGSCAKILTNRQKKGALGLMVQSAFCHENNICQKKAGTRL